MPLGSIRQVAQSAKTRMTSGFSGDERGVAAIEFAIIASVLLLMLLGICDVVPSWIVYNNAANSVSTAADITAEFSEMQGSDMVNVYSAAAAVMLPLPATGQSLRLTNVFSDGNGNAKVYWSCGNGVLPAYAALSLVTTTPTGVSFAGFLWLYDEYVGVWLNGTNTSYVLAEVSFTYSPPAQFVLRSPINMSGVSYYLPRASAYVGFPWDGVSTDSPTVPTSATKPLSVQLSNGAVCNYAN